MIGRRKLSKARGGGQTSNNTCGESLKGSSDFCCHADGCHLDHGKQANHPTGAGASFKLSEPRVNTYRFMLTVALSDCNLVYM